MVRRHRSSHAVTLQRATHLLAAHADVSTPEDSIGGQEELDALVVRLLVELAIQHR